jgi:hypothetical protein
MHRSGENSPNLVTLDVSLQSIFHPIAKTLENVQPCEATPVVLSARCKCCQCCHFEGQL